MHLFSFDIILLSKHLLQGTYKAATISDSLRFNFLFEQIPL